LLLLEFRRTERSRSISNNHEETFVEFHQETILVVGENSNNNNNNNNKKIDI